MNTIEKVECSKCNGKFEPTQYRVKTDIIVVEEENQTIKREKHILCCPICGKDLKNTRITCPHCKAEFEVDKVLRRDEKKSTYIGCIGFSLGVVIIGALFLFNGFHKLGSILEAAIFIGTLVMMGKFARKWEKIESACPACKKKLESS